METSVSEVKIDNWLSIRRLVLWEEHDWTLSMRARVWLWRRLNVCFILRSIRFGSSSDSMAESSSSSSISNAMKSMPDFERSWYVPWPMHSPFKKMYNLQIVRHMVKLISPCNVLTFIYHINAQNTALVHHFQSLWKYDILTSDRTSSSSASFKYCSWWVTKIRGLLDK